MSITLEGQKEQEFVDRIFEENNFLVKSNELQEKAFALGTVAFVPRVTGMKRDSQTPEAGTVPGSAEEIAIDYVTVENIFPLAWQNGVIAECAFASVTTVNGEDYCYLQIHKKVNGLYDIENRLYKYKNENLDTEVALSDVRGFERIPPVVHTGSDKRQFVIDRPNIANNFSDDIPLGISVYANAIDVLKGVDVAYDSYVNELFSAKSGLWSSRRQQKILTASLRLTTATSCSTSCRRIHRTGDYFAHRYDASHSGAQHRHSRPAQPLSSKCGFGENHYRFDSGSIATATQVTARTARCSARLRSTKSYWNRRSSSFAASFCGWGIPQ